MSTQPIYPQDRPRYARPDTVRLALQEMQFASADRDCLARPGTAAHKCWRKRVDQIETVLEFVSRVPVGRAY